MRAVGLVQSSGARPIDDFSEFGHNATLSADEYVDLGGVDTVVNIAKAWWGACKEDGAVKVKMPCGTHYAGS